MEKLAAAGADGLFGGAVAVGATFATSARTALGLTRQFFRAVRPPGLQIAGAFWAMRGAGAQDVLADNRGICSKRAAGRRSTGPCNFSFFAAPNSKVRL